MSTIPVARRLIEVSWYVFAPLCVVACFGALACYKPPAPQPVTNCAGICGHVVDSKTNKPMAGVAVVATIAGRQHVSLTSLNGSFALIGLASGRVEIEVPDWPSLKKTIMYRAGTTLIITFEVEDNSVEIGGNVEDNSVEIGRE